MGGKFWSYSSSVFFHHERLKYIEPLNYHFFMIQEHFFDKLRSQHHGQLSKPPLTKIWRYMWRAPCFFINQVYLPKQLNIMIWYSRPESSFLQRLCPMPHLARRVTYHRDPTCVTGHGTSLAATRALVGTILAPTPAPRRATKAPTKSSATQSRFGVGATVGWFRNLAIPSSGWAGG